MTPLMHNATAVLNDARDALLAGDVHGAMDALYDELADLRASLPSPEWQTFATAVRAHPVHSLLLHSPFTRRAFEKPRGYAGDAALIDFIYGCGHRPRELTTLGHGLYSWEFETPGCRSVRHRRMCLAREIDLVAERHARPAVLSVACGHLREAELSVAVRDGRARITAIDQDVASVALVNREYGELGVAARTGTVLDILRRRVPGHDFLLAYAAGLYDYLDDDVAAALTAGLFRTLASGGRLFLAGFTPDTRDAGYMETSMDWRLIYRDEARMARLLARVPEVEVAQVDQFRDPNGNLAYMRVVRT